MHTASLMNDFMLIYSTHRIYYARVRTIVGCSCAFTQILQYYNNKNAFHLTHASFREKTLKKYIPFSEYKERQPLNTKGKNFL